MGRFSGSIIFLLFLFLSPFSSEASDSDLEKELQKNLEQSKVIINKAINKLSNGISAADEVTQLKGISENVKAAHLSIQEKFTAIEENTKSLGSKAIDRHKAMSEGYRKALEEYLALVENLPSEEAQSTQYSVLST